MLDRKPAAALRRPAPARRDGTRDRARAAGRSSWTSRSRIWTRSCASGCAPRWRSCTRSSAITTVYVTHDQTEAMTLGTRVAVMRDGKIVQVAEPQVLYDEPARPLRRRLHRLARDEPRRGRRSTATSCASAGTRSRSTTHRRPAGDVGPRARRHPAGGLRGRRSSRRLSSRASTSRWRWSRSSGADTHVFFRVDAPRVTADAGREEDDDATLLAEERMLFTARVDPRTRIRAGSSARARGRSAPTPLLRSGHRARGGASRRRRRDERFGMTGLDQPSDGYDGRTPMTTKTEP